MALTGQTWTLTEEKYYCQYLTFTADMSIVRFEVVRTRLQGRFKNRPGGLPENFPSGHPSSAESLGQR